jgi:hypothetical protein
MGLATKFYFLRFEISLLSPPTARRATMEVFDPDTTRKFCLLSLSLNLILRPTISRPVCLGVKHPSGAYDQIFLTVRQLRVCWCGALSLTRRRVCRLQFLLALASAVIFGSQSRGTRDHNLLSQIRDLAFRRLLRLAGLWWRYSTPPPHRLSSERERELLYDWQFTAYQFVLAPSPLRLTARIFSIEHLRS